MKILFTLFLLLTVVHGITASAQTTPAPIATPASVPDNEEMKTIFIADQMDRGNNPFAHHGDSQPKPLTGPEIRRNDTARDVRVKQMLNAGILHTGTDFFRAALVFQHSGASSETLLAHVLASIAVAKGNPDGLWLSAATLDRYLRQINQKQIFGTQFKSLPGQTAPPYSFEQDDLEPDTLSDSLRAELCVTSLSAQTKGLPGQPPTTQLSPCPARKEMKDRATEKSR
jgi:hypothetical protein